MYNSIMFDNTKQRIGFACKYMHSDQSLKKKELEEIQRPFNTKSTTVAWLNRQTREVAEQRLWDIMVHNIQAYYNLIEYVGKREPVYRMVRLGSDCLPVYTQQDWCYYWQKPDVVAYCEREFAKVGELARKLDVRLSMHPGQFTCLASDRPDVVERSIDEFEYHVDMIRYMGYGQQWQDFKCNVHVSGKLGVDGIRQSLTKLSPEARNCITFENDEYACGLDQLIELADDAALVFDNHHQWIHSGEHLRPTDDRFKRVIDSWRGVRPAMHYSLSREEYLTTTDTNVLPSMDGLLTEGYKKGKLRAHSDYYVNNALNDLLHEFWQVADIMAESKSKNLATQELVNYFEQKALESV